MKTMLMGLLAALPLTLASALELPAELQQATPGEWRMFEMDLQPGVGAPCCVDWKQRSSKAAACGLDDDGWTFDDRNRADDERVRVFLRRSADGIDRIHAYGSSCALDASAEAVTAVSLGEPQATALLIGLAHQVSKNVSENATATLAMQAGSAADQALIALAAPTESVPLRRSASFWLTQARGETGFQAVKRLLQNSEDSRKFRRHAVFALSQSEAADRDQALIELSQSDPDREIRGEALFWLAQVSPVAAEPVLLNAAHDPDRRLSDKAIFGLSQLPAERAVKQLGLLAADRDLSRETRKQALFWLSQTDAESALPEVDRLLGVEAK